MVPKTKRTRFSACLGTFSPQFCGHLKEMCGLSLFAMSIWDWPIGTRQIGYISGAGTEHICTLLQA